MLSISVVIPAYNRSAFIRRAVSSALEQTLEPLEVIVVDDGSSDDTASVVQGSFGADPRVRYIRQENRGAGGARNTGIREARGELIALLDSDDEWHPEKLEIQSKALEALPDSILVWSDIRAVNPEGRVVHERYLRKMYQAYRFFPSNGDLFDIEIRGGRGGSVFGGNVFGPLVLGNLIHTSTVIVRSCALREAGLFREDLRVGEDHELYLRLARGRRFCFVPEVTADYTVAMPDSLTALERRKFAEEFLRFFETNLPEASMLLPKSALERCHADALMWVSSERASAGDWSSAIRYAMRSLRVSPSPSLALAALGSAAVPSALKSAAKGVLSLF